MAKIFDWLNNPNSKKDVVNSDPASYSHCTLDDRFSKVWQTEDPAKEAERMEQVHQRIRENIAWNFNREIDEVKRGYDRVVMTREAKDKLDTIVFVFNELLKVSGISSQEFTYNIITDGDGKIVDVVLPKSQKVTPAHCIATTTQYSDTKVDLEGRIGTYWSHSHSNFSVFLSGTDVSHLDLDSRSSSRMLGRRNVKKRTESEDERLTNPILADILRKSKESFTSPDDRFNGSGIEHHCEFIDGTSYGAVIAPTIVVNNRGNLYGAYRVAETVLSANPATGLLDFSIKTSVLDNNGKGLTVELVDESHGIDNNKQVIENLLLYGDERGEQPIVDDNSRGGIIIKDLGHLSDLYHNRKRRYIPEAPMEPVVHDTIESAKEASDDMPLTYEPDSIMRDIKSKDGKDNASKFKTTAQLPVIAAKPHVEKVARKRSYRRSQDSSRLEEISREADSKLAKAKLEGMVQYSHLKDKYDSLERLYQHEVEENSSLSIENMDLMDKYSDIKSDHDLISRDYDTLVVEHNTLVDDHNELAKTYNGLVDEHESLIRTSSELKDNYGSLHKLYVDLQGGYKQLETKIIGLNQKIKEIMEAKGLFWFP